MVQDPYGPSIEGYKQGNGIVCITWLPGRELNDSRLSEKGNS